MSQINSGRRPWSRTRSTSASGGTAPRCRESPTARRRAASGARSLRSPATVHCGLPAGCGGKRGRESFPGHIAGSDRPLTLYSLDVIISVGYRVKSPRGTLFRIWATRVLRDHLVQGYAVHERRLKELNRAVRLIADVARRRALSGDEASALLRVVADYSYALDVLDDYDHQRIVLGEVTRGKVVPLVLEEARQARTLSGPGIPPMCTTLPSIATPGVCITP